LRACLPVLHISRRPSRVPSLPVDAEPTEVARSDRPSSAAPASHAATSCRAPCPSCPVELYLQLKSESALSHRNTRLLRAAVGRGGGSARIAAATCGWTVRGRGERVGFGRSPRAAEVRSDLSVGGRPGDGIDGATPFFISDVTAIRASERRPITRCPELIH